MIQYLLVLAYLLLATTVESLVPLKPHLVTGYWQNWNAPSSGGLIQLRDVSPLYDVVAIAFAIQGSPAGSLSFTLYSGVTNFKSDVALLNTRGQSVVLSIGGATGNINLQSEEDADAFANSAYSIMTEYGFDGVDIDIENKFDNPELIVSALRKLKVLFGEYYIFMAPQTVNVQAAVASSQWADYLYIIDEIGDDITLYYNSGSMLGNDGMAYVQGTVDFVTSLADVLIDGGHLRPDQVGLGYLLTAGSGQQDITKITQAWNCLTKGETCGAYTPAALYPTLRGVMYWSINADAVKNYDAVTRTSKLIDESVDTPDAQTTITETTTTVTITSTVLVTVTLSPGESPPTTSASLTSITTIAAITSTTLSVPTPQITLSPGESTPTTTATTSSLTAVTPSSTTPPATVSDSLAIPTSTSIIKVPSPSTPVSSLIDMSSSTVVQGAIWAATPTTSIAIEVPTPTTEVVSIPSTAPCPTVADPHNYYYNQRMHRRARKISIALKV